MSLKRIKTKIAILNGELKAGEGSPITQDGRVGKGVTLEVGKDVPEEIAQSWLDAGKAVVAEGENAEKATKPAPTPKQPTEPQG